jgi:hypothetical protein
VIKAAELFLNGTTSTTQDANGNLKLLPSFNSTDFYADQNASFNYEPKIPEYITLTSMVFCIAIMCLGLIGNIMVNEGREMQRV